MQGIAISLTVYRWSKHPPHLELSTICHNSFFSQIPTSRTCLERIYSNTKCKINFNIILTCTSIFLTASLFVCRVKSMNLQSPSTRASVITIALSVYVSLLLFLVWVLQFRDLTHISIDLLMKLRRVLISSEF